MTSSPEFLMAFSIVQLVLGLIIAGLVIWVLILFGVLLTRILLGKAPEKVRLSASVQEKQEDNKENAIGMVIGSPEGSQTT